MREVEILARMAEASRPMSLLEAESAVKHCIERWYRQMRGIEGKAHIVSAATRMQWCSDPKAVGYRVSGAMLTGRDGPLDAWTLDDADKSGDACMRAWAICKAVEHAVVTRLYSTVEDDFRYDEVLTADGTLRRALEASTRRRHRR